MKLTKSSCGILAAGLICGLSVTVPAAADEADACRSGSPADHQRRRARSSARKALHQITILGGPRPAHFPALHTLRAT